IPALLVFRSRRFDSWSGAKINSIIEVMIADTLGTVVDTASRDVTISLTDSATITGTLSVRAVQGVARFNDLRVDAIGPHVLKASSGTLLPDTVTFRVAAYQPGIHMRFR